MCDYETSGCGCTGTQTYNDGGCGCGRSGDYDRSGNRSCGCGVLGLSDNTLLIIAIIILFILLFCNER